MPSPLSSSRGLMYVRPAWRTTVTSSPTYTVVLGFFRGEAFVAGFAAAAATTSIAFPTCDAPGAHDVCVSSIDTPSTMNDVTRIAIADPWTSRRRRPDLNALTAGRLHCSGEPSVDG